jgi:hypothetical protein
MSNQVSVNAQSDSTFQALSTPNFGEELYAIISKDYPYCAGKITGMLLELDEAELYELLQNPVSLKERVDEANHLLNSAYPWGHIDAIFIPPCVHSRSSACETNLEEVEKMDVREEYRARVYATNPMWHNSIINDIVEYFIKQNLNPDEMYDLFVNFEEFKRQVYLIHNNIH